MKTYAISEFKNNDFVTKMDKFSRRAAKLNLDFGYTLESTSEGVYLTKNDFEETVKNYYTIYNYSVYGESPLINGYSFLAKIETIESGVNLIHSYNESFDFTAYRDMTSLICEHCNVNRFRLFYFLVQNEETKEVKMLGHNCLAQYIAQPNAEDIANFYNDVLGLDKSFTSDDMEETFKNNRSGFSISIKSFLAYAINNVNKFGYVSTKNDGVTKLSTKESTLIDYYETGSNKVIISDDIAQQAESMVDYVTCELTNKKELNNYESTILTLLDTGRMKTSHAGYIVSIIPLYNKMMEVKVVRESQPESLYLGEVGNKINNVECVVTFYNKYVNNFNGYTHLYKFNNNGNVITYFSSKDLFLEVGYNVIIKSATVKKHDSYNGINQTVITRGKIEVKE
jgi:hypothetical protein